MTEISNEEKKEQENKKLSLIPKIEDYIEYVIVMLIKIPRTEKFSIGTETKVSMYKMINNVLHLYKLNKNYNGKQELELLNNIDAELNCQRIFLRIMWRQHWIDTKKFEVTMSQIYEIGKIHRWIVDQFLKEYFETTFIQTTYACIKNRGMHKACLDVQNAMKHCKRIWGNYYILKMDVRKYFDSIDKDILYRILSRKIQDYKLLKIIKQIVYSTEGKKGQPIRKLHISNICQYIVKRSRSMHKTPTEM